MASDSESGGSYRKPCPSCGTEMERSGPTAWHCPECDRDYWKEGDSWWSCDVSGEPELVETATDGGTTAAEKLLGCYEYRGDGEWFKIKEPWWDDADCDIVADGLNYSEVPHEVRERAYEIFDGDPVFLQPDGDRAPWKRDTDS